MSWLSAEGVAHAAEVSVRWRDVANAEPTWRQLCHDAMRRAHPKPDAARVAAAASSSDSSGGSGSEEEEHSLSVARQQVLDERLAAREAVEARVARATRAREEVVAMFKATVRATGSFRAAYPTIPQVRTAGVYTLRHSYVRRGVEDAYHPHPGVIRCVYNRTFRFRHDGSLAYCMLAGGPGESLKELKKPTSGRVSVGRWSLEGDTVRAVVATGPRAITRWTLTLTAAEGGANNRLAVSSLVLCESATDPGMPIESVEGEALVWLPVPVWAT